MGASEWVAIGLAVLGLIVAIIGFIVNGIRESIKLLFDLHTKDVEKLAALELRVATDHPTRDVIRDMFADFKKHFDDRFDSMERLLCTPDRRQQ